MRKSLETILGIGTIALVLSACPHKGQMTQNMAPEPTQTVVETSTPTVETSPIAEWKDYKEIPELTIVHFDFDKADLHREAREILQKNAQAMTDHSDWQIKIEGNCDERGTVEYNFALGERRAKAVHDYYKDLGVQDDRMSMISYGKEKPVCTDQTEACWEQNRSAITTARPKNTSMSSSSSHKESQME